MLALNFLRSSVVLTVLLFISSNTFALAFEPAKHPAKSIEFWGSVTSIPISKKINRKIPPELLDYIRKDNLSNGFREIPKPIELEPEFEHDVRAAVDGLPKQVLELVNAKLVGVFFVTDLGGSGYTEALIDRMGAYVAGLVVLDVASLNRSANEWATWKESSPYRFDRKSMLKATIAANKDDNRKSAIQYILLHELGHVVSIANPLLPHWGVRPDSLVIGPEMKFFNATWRVKNNTFVSLYDEAWVDRKQTTYYAAEERKLAGSSASANYRQLLRSNFATPYAATNPFDDFAEAFANYVHVVLMKKPWRIEFTSPGKKLSLKPCWEEPRCHEKRRILEALLRKTGP